MIGMDARTGKRLEGDAHLAQSCADILTTPIGSCVMLRDYGSAIPELIDQPVNPLTRIRVFAATAVALARWEPRILLHRVTFDPGEAPAHPVLFLEGRRTDTATPNALVALTIPLRPAT